MILQKVLQHCCKYYHETPIGGKRWTHMKCVFIKLRIQIMILALFESQVKKKTETMNIHSFPNTKA